MNLGTSILPLDPRAARFMAGRMLAGGWTQVDARHGWVCCPLCARHKIALGPDPSSRHFDDRARIRQTQLGIIACASR